jgi:uncharacterized protein (DUF1684 family)
VVVTEADYARTLANWRAGQERSLRGERSWLSLVALEWIRGEETRLGSDPQCDIVLPDRTVPALVGVLRLEGERIVLQLDGGVEARIRGRPITHQVVRPDSASDPDVIDVGRLSLMVIARGGRWGLRIWDRESPRRRTFPGRDWFPICQEALVSAVAVSASGETFEVVNTLGGVERIQVPAWIQFEMNGVACSWAPFSLDDEGLFLAFADRTNGASTYPGGRFLRAAPPVSGRLTLDFNRATNPPCAFTAFATCPLPPSGNRLPMEMAAGEMYRA